jgi:hypothetical protein
MVLLSLAVFFLLGVFLGDRLEPTATALWLFALGSVLEAAALAAFKRPLLPAFLALLLVLGALRSEAVEGGEVGGLERFHSQSGLNVQGLVASYPHTTQRSTSFCFSVDQVKQGDRWVESSGEVLVTLRPVGRANEPA